MKRPSGHKWRDTGLSTGVGADSLYFCDKCSSLFYYCSDQGSVTSEFTPGKRPCGKKAARKVKKAAKPKRKVTKKAARKPAASPVPTAPVSVLLPEPVVERPVAPVVVLKSDAQDWRGDETETDMEAGIGVGEEE